jgi:hypothetical protein
MNGSKIKLMVALFAGLILSVHGAAGQTWSELVTGAGPTTGGATANYDARNNRLIVFLPQGGSTPAQTWVLTNANGLGGTPAWIELQPTGTAPEDNGASTAVYDAPANQLIVYGGCSASCGSPLSTVYVLTNANGLGGTPAWSESFPTNPIAREAQSAVYDPTTNSMITFGGGLAFFGTDQNDTNVLAPANGSSPTWTTLSTAGGPPPIREGHSAVYNSAKNTMIIFGGDDAVSTCCPYDIVDYNDVWTLSNANGHGGTPTWTQLQPQGTPPPTRTDHSAVYDQSRNVMYIFGGMSWSNTNQSWSWLGDVWKLTNADGLGAGASTWTQIGQLGTPPGGNSSQGAGFDTVDQRMMIFGGTDRNDVSEYLTFILDLKQH